MQVRINFRYTTALKNIFGHSMITFRKDDAIYLEKCAQIISLMFFTLKGVCIYQEYTDVPKLSQLGKIFELKILVLNNYQSHPNFIQSSLGRFVEL